jgi:hypothetical protein
VVRAPLETGTGLETSDLEDVVEHADEEQQESFSSFAALISNKLFGQVVRLAHGMASALGQQDDQWQIPWAARTGFPVCNYQERYNNLTNFPISFMENPEMNNAVDITPLLSGTGSLVEVERDLWISVAASYSDSKAYSK